MMRRRCFLLAPLLARALPHSTPCDLGDPTARPALARKRLLNVFVAGVEGSGHHGLVYGLLLPLLAHATGRGDPRDNCIRAAEMPFYENTPRAVERVCGTIGRIGWESFPSQRRVYPNERLSLLYESAACFAGKRGRPGGFPTKWAKLRRADACYRCATWRATLEDAYARHLPSDRLDVAVLQASQPKMRVLFLWRNFVHAVFSHVPWDGGARGHAMMMAVHLAGLADDAARMAPGTWKVVGYEQLLDAKSYDAVARGRDVRRGRPAGPA